MYGSLARTGLTKMFWFALFNWLVEIVNVTTLIKVNRCPISKHYEFVFI